MNACESGELSPNFYDGFVRYFLAKGARGVIGTECKTPGFFASEWAKAFFDLFFTVETLGSTVLALRGPRPGSADRALGDGSGPNTAGPGSPEVLPGPAPGSAPDAPGRMPARPIRAPAV